MDVGGFKSDQGAAKRVGFLDESPLRYDSNCVEAAPEFAETADAVLARVNVRGQAVGAVSDHGDVGGRVDGDQFVEVPPRSGGNSVEDAPRHAAETADAVLAHGRMQGQAVGAVRDRGACGDPLGFQHEVSGGGRDPAESDLKAIMEVGGACYDKGAAKPREARKPRAKAPKPKPQGLGSGFAVAEDVGGQHLGRDDGAADEVGAPLGLIKAVSGKALPTECECKAMDDERGVPGTDEDALSFLQDAIATLRAITEAAKARRTWEKSRTQNEEAVKRVATSAAALARAGAWLRSLGLDIPA